MIANHHRFTSAVLLGTALSACNAPADVDVDVGAAASTTQAVAATTPVASVATARAQHAATLLSTGEVLVVGGVSRLGFVNTAERFDPLTGRWRGGGEPRHPGQHLGADVVAGWPRAPAHRRLDERAAL